MHATGSRLAGRYRLEEVVGRGGMSTVYRATDETLGRTVAVKILLHSLAEEDPTYSARFEREARAAAALANPAVVTIYDTGVDDASHYIVMEYIAGQSLEQILRQGQPLELSEALGIAARVADALAVAHAVGILHRDIKPANVMLTDTGNVKVLDFGIARRLDGTTITQVASIVGTAAYMAPERALGQAGDERADVYSLGCLLYAMLTGQPPFGGEIAAAILHQQINADPRPPSQLRQSLSPALDALILQTLAKDAADRPATAAELRDRLTQLAGVSGAAEAPAAAAAVTSATRPMTSATTPLLAATPRTRHREPLLADHRRRGVVMALATALITGVALALLSGGGPSGHQASSSHAAARTTHPEATRLRTTTTTTRPQTTPSSSKPSKPGPRRPPGRGGSPPGQGEKPPGQAKKHGGGGGGDGGD